jgi:hypothetical protein
MKKIELTQGQVTFVDDEDYEKLKQYKCYAVKKLKSGVFYAKLYVKALKQTHLLHRFLLGITDPNIQVDHKDRNRLNNQKENLRVATSAENARNRKGNSGSSSNYKGVYLKKHTRGYKVYLYWCALLRIDNKRILEKRFPYTPEGEIAAAKCYDEVAKKHHGEFANLNFK